MLFSRRASNYKAIREIQHDYQRVFASPAGRRVFADLALMWGHYGGDMEGMRKDLHPAFLWILDRMGVNHIDNVLDLANALQGIPPVAPRAERLDRDSLLDPEEEDEEYGNWRRPPGA